MPVESLNKSGEAVEWSTLHKDKNGRIISRQFSLNHPTVPTCLRLSCLIRYLKEALLYALVATYHNRRVQYAENNKNKEILERYRTGEPSPKTIWQAIHANIKLTCPICRKYNVDPLLGGKQ
jgi:hypothetical protein